MIDDFECMSETSNKLKKFLDSRKIFKNWLLYFIIYFKLSKSDSEIFETRSGLKMKIRVNSTDLMQLTTIWVDKEYAIPGFEINENDIIIDIGGHVGLFIVFCKQFCNNGKIFCFEPVKENYEQCMENIRINNLQNVNLFNMAVTKKTGEIPIYLKPSQKAKTEKPSSRSEAPSPKANGQILAAKGYKSKRSMLTNW